MNHESTLCAVRTLGCFAKSAQMSFDRNFAERIIGEAERSIPGEDWSAWSRRLVEAGESLNLRVRSLESTLDDVLVFVREGIPVAASIAGDGESGEWILIVEARGRKLKIVSGDQSADEKWIAASSIRNKIAERNEDGKCIWVIGQAALSCEVVGGNPSVVNKKDPVSPISRLMGLLKPEVRDLWVVGVFSLTVGILALAAPITVEALVNTVAFGRYLQPVLVLAILLFTFLAFASGMRVLIAFVVEILQRRLFVRVVEDLAYRLPRVQSEEFDNQYGPELTNRFFDIVTVQKTVSSLLVDGISIILQTVIGMVVLAVYHPFLLGFDIVLLFLIGVIIFGLGWGSVSSAIIESKKKYSIANWLQELARHQTAFKLHAGSQFALDRADQLAIDWLDARRDHFRVVMRQFIFALGLQAVAATALLGIGGWLVIMGEITLGQLVAAELIVMIIIGSFTKLGKHLESFYDLLASVDKLGYLFDLRVESHDKLFHIRTAEPVSLDVKELSYKYGGDVGLTSVSFHAEPGEAIGICGSAGSGKSTLAELIAGMRVPATGHVAMDGVDIRDLRPDSLREHLSLAQHPEIFHGTVAENIHLGRTNIGSIDIQEAIEIAGLQDEIRQLPEGANSTLQTNGAPLTTSQSARLMIARAVVGRPRLVLIDGTLDLLGDSKARKVLDDLKSQNAAWTLLVASGRSALLKQCDRVICLGHPADDADECCKNFQENSH